MTKYILITIAASEKNVTEIENATKSFLKIIGANNAKARIVYQGSSKEVIEEIENGVSKLSK